MKIEPNLTGVSETMLWTLHNRASEAMRPDGVIRDPHCIEIYRALDYDYEKSFGRADGSHAFRSATFDREILRFLEIHPDAAIINLAEGLETQRYRIETEGVHWYSIDLPKAIKIREQFIQPDEFHHHIARSVLETSWFDEVETTGPAMITSQGLFMYLPVDALSNFISALAHRFSGSRLIFDYIPHWFSNKTMSKGGFMKTPTYKAPPMPWGIARSELQPTFSKWMGKEVEVHHVMFTWSSDLIDGWVAKFVFKRGGFLRDYIPGICWIDIP